MAVRTYKQQLVFGEYAGLGIRICKDCGVVTGEDEGHFHLVEEDGMNEEQCNNIIAAVVRYDAAATAMITASEKKQRGEAMDSRDLVTVVEEFCAARQTLDNAINTRGMIGG